MTGSPGPKAQEGVQTPCGLQAVFYEGLLASRVSRHTWYRTFEDVPMKKAQVRAVLPTGGMSTQPSTTPDTFRLVTPSHT